MTDHYATLGVSYGSEDVVIQAAYRALMRKYHPDTNASAEAARRATEINAAFAILGNPQRRAAYDADENKRRQLAAVLQARPSPTASLKRRRTLPSAHPRPRAVAAKAKKSIIPALIFFLASLAVTSPLIWGVIRTIFFPPPPMVIYGPVIDRADRDEISAAVPFARPAVKPPHSTRVRTH